MSTSTGEMAERPWGSWIVLDEAPGWKTKKILVRPGHRLSLQRHGRRSEHWVVVQGRVMATVEDRVRVMEVGESIDVPSSAVHRLANVGGIDAIIIEVQRGGYTEEDVVQAVSDAAGSDLHAWFDRHVGATDDMDYEEVLTPAGLHLVRDGATVRIEPVANASPAQRAVRDGWIAGTTIR